MKRPLQLSLAIALALAGTNVMALGLGPVRVMSRLNQPLQAEIPVIQGTAGEAEGLLVSLADQEDFERLGISRSHLGVPLEFSVAKDSKGQVVIRVTSTEPVRSSYLDFLVEANWPKGRMLREYTVLLDPPITAPAAAPAVAAAPAAPAKSKPVATPRPAKPEPAPAPVAKAPATPVAPAPAPAPKAAAGDYGPTQAGETLSSVAAQMRQGSADLNQTMLALLKHNPDAFYRGNINALKRGVILRAPTADELQAIGSASEAASQVRAQIEDWRGVAASTTRVASAAGTPAAVPTKAPKAAPAKPGATAGTRDSLELVPPKAGKDSTAMADRPGAGSSKGTGTAANAGSESTRELARTREALAASEQASSELKSRVKQLEDLNSKSERLISLKDSEIAELQRKLKDLQAGKASTTPATTAGTSPASSAPATAVGTSPAASTPKPAAETATASTPIDKKDIWGDAAGTKPASGAKPTSDSTAAAGITAPAHEAGKPATPGQGTPAATDAGKAAVADAGTTPSTTTSAETGASKPETSPTATTTPVATTSPLAEPKPATPAKPAETKPAVKPAPAVAKPAHVVPWYEADWVKPAAIGGGVLVLLLAFLGLRKRKPAGKAKAGAPATSSVADSLGDSFAQGGGSANVMEAEIAHLQGQIAADPGNLGAHLELLSIYYADRNVQRFEDGAQHMHAYVDDPNASEWLEVKAMGEELAPHNPLWAHEGAHEAAHAAAAEHAQSEPHLPYDNQSFVDADAPQARGSSFVPPKGEPDFGFFMPPAHDHQAGAGAGAGAGPAAADFGFGSIPPLEDEHVAAARQPEPETTRMEPPMPATSDDELFSSDEAVATKLDLARAYMDMGDPDGARSMLEEVLAEGNDAQKGEAQRLIADLR